jgi:hypothetical protein
LQQQQAALQQQQELAALQHELAQSRSSHMLLAAAFMGRPAHEDDQDALNELEMMTAESSQEPETRGKAIT